jgi:hypothetical protein
MKTTIAVAVLIAASVFAGDKAPKVIAETSMIQVPGYNARYVHAVCFLVKGNSPDRKISFRWEDQPDAKGYRVEVSRNAGDFESCADLPQHVTSWQVADPKHGTYVYRVSPIR